MMHPSIHILATKPVRRAVRTILLRAGRVVAIKYTTSENYGFYDLPGGKIEAHETPMMAAKREFREETGMEIHNLRPIGCLILEYPEKIFDFEVFLAKDYVGEPKTTEENDSSWMKIDELLKKEHIFPPIKLLEDKNFYESIDRKIMTKTFIVDNDHHVSDML